MRKRWLQRGRGRKLREKGGSGESGRSRPKSSHAQISFKLLLQLHNDYLMSKR